MIDEETDERMECDDSEIPSPPSSPIMGYSGIRDHQSLADSGLIFCLCCKGQPKVSSQDHSFSVNGYILRREVINSLSILSNGNRSFSFNSSQDGKPQRLVLYSLFGNRKWDPTDIIQLQMLIKMCRKNINSLEILSDSMYSLYQNQSLSNLKEDPDDPSKMKPWELRKDVLQFLNVVLSRMKYFRRKLGLNQIQSLFSGLKKTLGKAKNWQTGLKTHVGYKDGNDCTSASYHSFHLNLELRWSLLIIYGADLPTLKWILEDLIYLSYFKYTIKGQATSLLSEQPFNCWCTKEIWTMIRLLLEDLEKNFWEIFTEVMKIFLSSNQNQSQSDLIFFSIWLTSHIATLSDYNLAGLYIAGRERIEGYTTGNAYPYVNSLLKDWAARGGKSAEITKMVSGLIKFWGFDLDVVVLFWNHWVPKIDKNLEVTSLEQYASVEKWLKLVKVLSLPEGAEIPKKKGDNILDETIMSNDSFFTFLCLLVSHSALCSPKDWRKLKSNISMKLNKNNVSTYGEIGLLRVCCLYLTLANVTDDTLSMCERLKEIISYGKDSPGRKKTIFRAQATMILILLEKGLDLRTIDLVSKFMSSVNEQLSKTLDSSTKELVMIYLDLLESLPSSPAFKGKSLGREILISPNLTMWLSSCGPNYVVRTLRVLNKLTEWILSSKSSNPLDYSSERDDLFKRINERTIQFVSQAVILNANRVPSTDIQPMANLAADLTLLSRGILSNDIYTRQFDHFALNEWTCPEVSQFFVSRLCSFHAQDDSESMIILSNSNLSDIKWCQVWIRLIALDCSIPDELNVKFLGPGFSSTSNEILLKRFCSRSEEWSRGDVQNILAPLMTLVKAAGAGNVFKDNPTVVLGIVNASVILLKDFGFNKLYVKGDSMSVAHKILETFVPPPVGNLPWEKLPQPVVQALKQRLFDVFETVVSNPGYSSDSYLTRKIYDLITFAFLAYVGPGEEIDDNHPAIRILMYAEDKEIHSVLHCAIPQLCKLAKEGKLTQRFVFAVAALRKKGLTSSAIRFLPGAISIFISSTTHTYDPNMQRMCKACASIIEYACAFGLTPFKALILDAFEKSMEVDFAFKNKRFFELSSLLVRSNRPQVKKFLRIEILPLYEKYVIICERRRASGTDNSLRLPLEKLERDTTGFDT